MAEVIRGTTLITCPFCKSEKQNSHEWRWHGIHRCDDCRGHFQWNRIATVTYTTEPIAGGDPLQPDSRRECPVQSAGDVTYYTAGTGDICTQCGFGLYAHPLHAGQGGEKEVPSDTR